MEQKKTLKDPILKMDILIWRVIKQLIKRKKYIVDKSGLTSSQFDILSAINYLSGSQSEVIQIELSDKTDIDPMTTSTILRNLEKKGLITRHRNEANTRTVIVELTDEGLYILKEAYSQLKRSSTKIYKEIDKSLLTIQLLKISENLNN